MAVLLSTNIATASTNLDNEDKNVGTSPIYRESGGTDWLGRSMFDEGYWLNDYAGYDDKDVAWMLTDRRSENQGPVLKILAGLGKGIINIILALVEETVGLAASLVQCIVNAVSDNGSEFYKGLWDNPVNNFMDKIRWYMQDWMPNYTTHDERMSPYAARNIFSANGIAFVIEKIGFLIGAYLSFDLWWSCLFYKKLYKFIVALPLIAYFIVC